LINEIGCSDNGDIWISFLAKINGNQQTAIIPMSQEKGREVYMKIGEALAMGATWKKTGIKPGANPNVGNSPNPNKGKPPGD